MAGMAAIAFCAAFTSCTKSENVYDETRPTQDIVAKYNDAFIKTFGQPASNQDWGFGTIYSKARTRTENANANEWADPNKAYGGLEVPPPLTDEQIAVVKKYFQTHPNLGYQDPKWTNYFMQQVYKGHTSVPQGCATPEQYLAASGGNNYIIASDHMDHLIAVDTEKGIYDHINNFNHGDCSPTTVLDNGEVVGGKSHTDKIMYMMNSTTKSFGYHNSDGSLYHTGYTGLVSYKTIMQEMGAEANCLNDGWERSFMGFDFEQMVGSDVYAKEWGQTESGWGVIGYKTFEFEGKTYNFLTSETNMYCADRSEKTWSEVGGVANFNDRPDDATIRNLLAKGYLPHSDTLKDWVKVGGCADGYYSDWIVCLTEAKTNNDNDIRIIAEDLNAEAVEGDISDSDWDFNDVVFDVKFTGDNTATITLVAAGGTLPLIVGVQNPVNGQSYPSNEVHALYQVDTDYMVNTKAELKGLKGGDSSLKPTINVTITGVKAQNGKNIPIHVQKIINDEPQWIELAAITGEPAAKIGVSPDFTYCLEKDDIRSTYSNFTTWVRTTNPTIWWNGVQ